MEIFNIIQNNEKFAIVVTNNNTIKIPVDKVIKKIETDDNTYLIVEKNNKLGLIKITNNTSYKITLPISYINIELLSNSIIILRNLYSFQLFNIVFEKVILDNIQYLEKLRYSYPHIKVLKDNQLQYIHIPRNNLKIFPYYIDRDQIIHYNGKYGIFNEKTLSEALKPEYDYIYQPGLIYIVKKGNKYGVYKFLYPENKLVELLPVEMDSFKEIRYSYFSLQKGEKNFILDKRGNFLFISNDYKIHSIPEEDFLIMKHQKTNKYALIYNKNIIIENQDYIEIIGNSIITLILTSQEDKSYLYKLHTSTNVGKAPTLELIEKDISKIIEINDSFIIYIKNNKYSFLYIEENKSKKSIYKNENTWDKLEIIYEYFLIATRGNEKFLLNSYGEIMTKIPEHTPIFEFYQIQSDSLWRKPDVTILYYPTKNGKFNYIVHYNRKYQVFQECEEIEEIKVINTINDKIYVIIKQNSKQKLFTINNDNQKITITPIPGKYDYIQLSNNSEIFLYRKGKVTEIISENLHIHFEEEEFVSVVDYYYIIYKSKKNNKYGVIEYDDDKKIDILPPVSDTKPQIIADFIIYKIKDKYGIKHKDDTELKLEYKYAYINKNNFEKIIETDKWFLIIESKKLNKVPKNFIIENYTSEYTIVKSKNYPHLYGMLSTDGKIILPPIYKEITEIYDNFFIIQQQHKRGVVKIDFNRKDHEIIIYPEYDTIEITSVFSKTFIILTKNGKYYLYDLQNQTFVLDTPVDYIEHYEY